MTDLIFEWGQALITLMAAEERLSMALERDVADAVHGANRADAPAVPRAPRSALRSRRELARSKADEGTQSKLG